MSGDPGHEVTELLGRLDDGDRGAEQRIWNLLYDELRRLAHRARSPHASLETTALVHELYLRLEGGGVAHVQDTAHFINLAARTMRQILVDRARRRQAAKRDGELSDREPDTLGRPEPPAEEILAIHGLLDDLAGTHPRHARLVELHFFAGLSLDEAAVSLDISRATAYRDWKAARGWFYSELEEEPEAPPDPPEVP